MTYPTAPAPLFRDPIFDGPTDPTVIYNRDEKTWWIVYTQRRANVPCHAVTWVHGTDLGVASSDDHGQTWLYRGTLNLEPIEKGRNTFWAPEILWHENRYHMYVSYITGVPDAWRGPRHILHYTSTNLWDWQYVSTLPLSSDRVIDACVHKTEQGFRMWYKDEAHDSHTFYADSPDLYTWESRGEATCDQSQEGPNVFFLGDRYWMIADIWDGQAVYHSPDLLHWTRQEENLMAGKGNREDDGNRAHHADVLPLGDTACMFYFVHPTSDSAPKDSHMSRRSSLQAAGLVVRDGKLVSLRDEPFPFYLPTLEP
ncbi:MAG: glycosyl hydrolase [Clostridia bacterium]|nr:glycosyl hydrolase [Clostridia bacterium]